MKTKSLIWALIACFAYSSLNAVAVDFGDKIEQKDINALRDWVNTKRQVTVKERGGNLSISGEVRTEFQATSEKLDGIKQRGNGGAIPGTASRAFDVEVNIMLDYRTDRTWAAVKLEFDNNAGTSSGTTSKISLERAFFGGRLVSRDTYTIDMELGRRFLATIFDSRIQFGSLMDGILVKYDHAMDFLGDLFLRAAPFVVDERVDQYAYVGELGLLNMFNTGFYSKYSLIDWNTKHLKNKIERNRYRFLNSQLTLGYKLRPKWLNKLTTFYAAGLMNHAAHTVPMSGEKLANLAWYTGFSIGELRQKGDWSFDLNYQYVQAQAIPDFDGSGIGRGNAKGTGFYSTKKGGAGVATTKENAVGAGNYKGFSVELLYLLTRNITIYQSWKQSINQNDNIGPFIRYKQYELEFIYAF
ncbi:MAG: hypothetical protein KAR79_03895 [Simkaniaceae bacterium]|nr:hypothetical protein [Simkaniaceae bacterium]